MERFAWKGRIRPGMQEEYKRRHDEIWPEMLAYGATAGMYSVIMSVKKGSPSPKRPRLTVRSWIDGTIT